MWRSLFFAVGIYLMLLGAEALIFERVDINASAKLPKFMNGLFENSQQDSFLTAAAGQDPYLNVPQPGNPASNPNNSIFRQTSSQSQFGPSRFSGPQLGNYGGPRADLSRSGLTANPSQNGSIAAYPASYSNPAGANGPLAPQRPSFGPRVLVPKDWMPWSLLAAGAIITLYTSSNLRSFDS